MSDLSKLIHGFGDLITGKTDYNGFSAGEAAVFQHRIEQTPVVYQPVLQDALQALKVGASSLVGAGLTALGPLIAQSTDQQADVLVKLMTLAGIPTEGPLSIAEHAALVTIINALKAHLDKLHLHFATQDGEPATPVQAAQTVTPVAQPEAKAA